MPMRKTTQFAQILPVTSSSIVIAIPKRQARTPIIPPYQVAVTSIFGQPRPQERPAARKPCPRSAMRTRDPARLQRPPSDGSKARGRYEIPSRRTAKQIGWPRLLAIGVPKAREAFDRDWEFSGNSRFSNILLRLRRPDSQAIGATLQLYPDSITDWP
jgi:hypothetical protein